MILESYVFIGSILLGILALIIFYTFFMRMIYKDKDNKSSEQLEFEGRSN